MAQDLTMFSGAQVPAHAAEFFGDAGNIPDRQTVPSLSPQGKVWTVSLNGEKTKLMRKNADGDTEPVSVMKVVVLDFAKRRGRTYYEGSYDSANESPPVCWSEDGNTPDESVPAEIKNDRTAWKCDGCPMAVKGSRITDNGKAVAACSQHRMLAVVPANKLDFEPLRLKIAVTSDYDKQSPDAEAQGWFAFSNYVEFLKSRGVNHTAALVTKMKFDQNANYPKIFFAADRWLEKEELATVAPIAKSEGVGKLLSGFTPAGVDGVAKGEEQKKPAAEEKKDPVMSSSDDEDEDIILEGVGTSTTATKVEASVEVVDAEVIEEPVEKKAKPKAAEKKAEPKATVSPDVSDLLEEWGD